MIRTLVLVAFALCANTAVASPALPRDSKTAVAESASKTQRRAVLKKLKAAHLTRLNSVSTESYLFQRVIRSDDTPTFEMVALTPPNRS